MAITFDQLFNVCINGEYAHPASKRYESKHGPGNRHAINVCCNGCNAEGLTTCYGIGDMDLCIPCVKYILNKGKNNRVARRSLDADEFVENDISKNTKQDDDTKEEISEVFVKQSQKSMIYENDLDDSLSYPRQGYPRQAADACSEDENSPKQKKVTKSKIIDSSDVKDYELLSEEIYASATYNNPVELDDSADEKNNSDNESSKKKKKKNKKTKKSHNKKKNTTSSDDDLKEKFM
jgi:hypothetical protein